MTSLSIEKPSLLTNEELALVNPETVPNHVAIIMDGNRRWARAKGLHATVGHWQGAAVLTDIVRVASDLGVKALTVFSFSTENWLRKESEVNSLMELIKTYLLTEEEEMIKEGVRLCTIGDLSKIPEDVQEVLAKVKRTTAAGRKIDLILAINYGARDEMCRAIQAVSRDVAEKRVACEEITEELISSYLDTSNWKDPDLLIRTSGELRVSNFLLWQICYAEIYVTKTLWPDFAPRDFLEAVLAFQNRELRKGT